MLRCTLISVKAPITLSAFVCASRRESRANSSGSNGRNRLLAALRPADFSLLDPNLKDFSMTLGDVLQEPGVEELLELVLALLDIPLPLNLVEASQFSRDRDRRQLCLAPDTIALSDFEASLVDIEHCPSPADTMTF
jgi:hypothetical protein